MVNDHFTPDERAAAEQQLRTLQGDAYPSVEHLIAPHLAAMLALGDELDAAAPPVAAPRRARRMRRFRPAQVAIVAGSILVCTAGLGLANVLPEPAQRIVEQVAAKVLAPFRDRESEPRSKQSTQPAATPQADASPDVDAVPVEAQPTTPRSAPTAAAPAPKRTTQPPSVAPPKADPPAETAPVFAVHRMAFRFHRSSDGGLLLHLGFGSIAEPCYRPGGVEVVEQDHRVVVTVSQRIDEGCTSSNVAREVTARLRAPLGERVLIDGSTGREVPHAPPGGIQPGGDQPPAPQ